MEKSFKSTAVLEKMAEKITWWVGSIQSLIVHTAIFVIAFALPVLGLVDFDKMLLFLTTVLSLEAIYLSIFIQLSVNKSHEHIEDLKEDVTEIQEDIEDIQEDIEEISDDIEDIQEDIEDIADEEDEAEDHADRAKNVMLKSNISTTKTEIKSLKEVIAKLQKELDNLKSEEEQAQ